MIRGLVTILGTIVLVAICVWLFFAIGAILWSWLWLFIVIFAIVIVFDWIIGPRYIRNYKTTITIQQNKLDACESGFDLENGHCVPKEE